MQPYIRIAIVLTIALLTGCATMSKEECTNADWHAVGYSDGSRGIHFQNLEKHRKSCGKYEIVPDAGAYRAGWDQGIRSYCTADNGYRAGRAGKAYHNICPSDVEADFLSGWDQGVREYCTPDNALKLGLNGHRYSGVCPAGLAEEFRIWYGLGRDVRSARSGYRNAERKVSRHEQQMSGATDPQVIAKLRNQYHALLRDEQRAYTQMLALEACMNNDWYEAGYRDGESGLPRRAREITGYCSKYGLGANGYGYREGWYEGVNHYCSYESGLYIGQSNQSYSGVCSGYGHREFWRGYEEGRRIYQAGRYEHHRPVRQAPPAHQQPPVRQQPHDNRDREMRQPPEHSRAAEPAERRQQPQKPAHDNRDREVRQPAPHNQAADPVEQRRQQAGTPVHDNRDKMKRPMPEKSQKEAAEEKRGNGKENGNGKKEGDDDEERGRRN